MSEIITKKKRGRKPKKFNSNIIKADGSALPDEDVNSEEEKIIFHLPITMNEINNHEIASTDMSIFIKNEKDIKNNDSKLNMCKIKSYDSDSIETLKSSSNINQINLISNNVVNKITTHNLNFTKNTKCWWCRNTFESPAVELPEDYYNNTFFCTGNFCSYNCMKSYNLDLNDTLTSKKESLMNLMYFLTYSEYKYIVPAPHWMALEEYGGTLTILQFRENSIINTKEYLILHPPLISRKMQIEESYKMNKLKEVPIDKVNKIYSDIDSEYTIKRNKPVQSTQLTLENTMGLKSKKKTLKSYIL
jgi:hypothetical protein